jgi:nicotinate-nucleotide adenylyltransferase
MRKTLGLFGGTFDPIHIGHLRMALELKQELALDELRLVPCHRPPHRGQPSASSQERVEMLTLALKDCPELVVDTREVNRDCPSYTVETLRELRAELGSELSLVLCMGADAFAGLASWFCWQELIQLAHIVVVARPGWELPQAGALADLCRAHAQDASYLTRESCGGVLVQTLRLLPVSATEIREQIRAGESAQFLVPDAVWNYINAKQLYR